MSRRVGGWMTMTVAVAIACGATIAPAALGAAPVHTPFPSLRPPAGCEEMYPDLAAAFHITTQAELDQHCREQLSSVA